MQFATSQSLLAHRHKLPVHASQRHLCYGRNLHRQITFAGMPGEAKVDVSRVKAEIVKLAGDKYGLDK